MRSLSIANFSAAYIRGLKGSEPPTKDLFERRTIDVDAGGHLIVLGLWLRVTLEECDRSALN